MREERVGRLLKHSCLLTKCSAQSAVSADWGVRSEANVALPGTHYTALYIPLLITLIIHLPDPSLTLPSSTSLSSPVASVGVASHSLLTSYW